MSVPKRIIIGLGTLYASGVAPILVAAGNKSLTLVFTIFLAAFVPPLAVAFVLWPDTRTTFRRIVGRLRAWLRRVIEVAGGHRKKTALIVLIVVLVSAAVISIRYLNPPGSCGKLTTAADGECVGVTDGSDGDAIFGSELATVMKAIAAENQQATHGGSGNYVTVAFLGPLTDKTVTGGRLSHQLEGAFIAQYQANHRDVGGGYPKIRLVLANEGDGEKQWSGVVARLKAMTGDPDHLVTVAGLGLSQQETVDAARTLSAASIPMVGDVITADGLDKTGTVGPGGKIPGLTRMAFPISAQFTAISSYLPNLKMHTALLVADASIDTDTPDLYTGSLAAAFRRGILGDYLKAGGNRVNPFGGDSGRSGLKNQFDRIAGNVCGINPPDMIFYAGRAVYLPDFLQYLRDRNCSSRAITVVTGSDATVLTLTPNIVATLGDQNAPISVIYSPLADPCNLMAAPPGSNDRRLYQEFDSDFTQPHFGARFAGGDLGDGWAIMAHDAVITAVKAIRNAATSKARITPSSVRIQLGLFTSSTNQIPGATGNFQIDSTTGNRTGTWQPPQVHYLGHAISGPARRTTTCWGR